MAIVTLPTGARFMQPEFAARLESFLVGGPWFTIIQLASTNPKTPLWQVALAGIDQSPGTVQLTAEDYAFAKAIDWTVMPSSLVAATNVTTYQITNWWYLVAAPGSTNIGGVVSISLKTPISESAAKAKAEAFATGVLKAGTGTPNSVVVVPDPATGSAAAGYTGFTVDGAIQI